MIYAGLGPYLNWSDVFISVWKMLKKGDVCESNFKSIEVRYFNHNICHFNLILSTLVTTTVIFYSNNNNNTGQIDNRVDD